MMSEKPLTFRTMHADHRQWHSENALWLDEIDCWGEECEAALDALRQLRGQLRQHFRDIQSHAEDVASNEEHLCGHERCMARFQSEGAGAELQNDLIVAHRKHDEKHRQQQEVHEQLKTKQHAALSQVAHLKAVLNEGESGWGPLRMTGEPPGR